MTTLVGIGAALTPEDRIQTTAQQQVLIEMRGIKLLGSGRDESPETTDGNTEPPKS
jgi:hypothetical protein